MAKMLKKKETEVIENEIVEEEIELNDAEEKALRDQHEKEKKEENKVSNEVMSKTLDLVTNTFNLDHGMQLFKFDIKKQAIKIGLRNEDYDVEIKIIDGDVFGLFD